MANQSRCSHCGQLIHDERNGVRMTPLKANIYDMIKRAGDAGVSAFDILATVYQGRTVPTYTAIKSHVAQINDILEETDWKIVSDRRNCNGTWPMWRLVRR